MDRDRDGYVLRRDLAQTISLVSRRFGIALSADAVFRALDMQGVGSLEFLHFAAACLHTQLSPLDSWLAKQSFDSIDSDEDGFISPCDVVQLFGELPRGLHTKDPIPYNLWHKAVCDAASYDNTHLASSINRPGPGQFAEGLLGLFGLALCNSAHTADRQTELIPTASCCSPDRADFELLEQHFPVGGKRPRAVPMQWPAQAKPSECSKEHMRLFRGLSSPTYVPMSAR